jgi:biotin-dependent carboxylase-like uncharacterized protein
MSPALRVLAPGLLTTVQDLGRVGHQHVGVPVSGALDAVALQVANALVGNAPGTAALEAACLGPTLQVEAEEVRVAVVGARADIEILPAPDAASGRRLPPLRSARLLRGEVLRIGALTGGTVLYIAVEGGFAIAPALGSLATDVRAGLGGWQGRALAAGDALPLWMMRASARPDLKLPALDLRPPRRVRAVAGPQDDHFADAEVEAFFAADYTVGPSADRMGMRLAGRALAHRAGHDIVSDAVAPGAIQVPGSGLPIVLLADRQTTGGYPKIATVISADIPALGRFRVGDPIAFERVTVEQAVEARRHRVAELAQLSRRMVPVVEGAGSVDAVA